MLLHTLFLQLPCLLAAALPLAADTTSPRAIVVQAQTSYEENTKQLLQQSRTSCNWHTVSIRKAWDDLTEAERSNYVASVHCLLAKKPARSHPREVPGARTWNDDFVWAHIKETNFIHGSGLLLPWHRQFMWAYEQTLRNECGYRGALPYWAWERHADDQSKSPVFQPGPTSFGGNGQFVPHGPRNGSLVGLPPGFSLSLPIPAGTGGGCIRDGAFKEVTINLGPVASANNTPDNLYGNQYNTRCITRDYYQQGSTAGLTHKTISDLWALESIHDFRPLLEALAHPTSHVFVGGEESDQYASPNDPVFYLLHAQIDRLWTVWQGQDYASRRSALDGTVTMQNVPPSENATLATAMHMGIAAGGDVPISRAMSATENDYCYMYA
ncbi:hypothetical protein HIM_04877 [Hirsutella minnesotensis 3608]|uniref:Tyrosinase copper-binding domain-containing protein n=1 Tax=Hirsutella minnesotensis 3608 TaxID=1043627 RepID=A0A0F7ZPL7_9HYPO|nr:hypothetical protein HIM_04877 [Hirsutella minnesotensis 3608]